MFDGQVRCISQMSDLPATHEIDVTINLACARILGDVRYYFCGLLSLYSISRFNIDTVWNNVIFSIHVYIVSNNFNSRTHVSGR
jgi:hypothetical protein